MPSGRLSRMRGSSARTARDTSSGLAVACLMMPRMIEVLSLNRVTRRSSSAAISALPTSRRRTRRSEEHTSELQSLMRISYAVFCLKKKKQQKQNRITRGINNTHIDTKDERYLYAVT